MPRDITMKQLRIVTAVCAFSLQLLIQVVRRTDSIEKREDQFCPEYRKMATKLP
jgi:hypothetical protein